jgi:hypothetical protein
MAPVFLKFRPKNDALGLALLVAALCLFAGAAGLSQVLIPQETGAVQAALARSHSVQSELDKLASDAGTPKLPPLETSLQRFGRLPSVVNELEALSAQNGVALTEATSRPLEAEPNAQIGKVSLQTHMKGGYKPITKVISSILASYPAVALNAVIVRRARSTDANVDADIQFTYFYRIQS